MDELDIVVNRYITGADELLRGRYIVIGGDLHKAFEIRHREIELNDRGKQSENWRIKALGLKSVINRILALPPTDKAYDRVSADAESVMKYYVDTNAINGLPMRNIPNLVIAPNLNRGSRIEWQARYKNLSEEISEISELSGLGWNISVDYVNKRMVFDVMEGRNLVASQYDLPPVIFSPKLDSLRSIEYVSSDLNYRNVVYVAGAGEGVDRRVIVLGDAEGYDRHELFVDARDIQETENIDGEDVPIPEDVIIARLTARGMQKLAESSQEEYLSAQNLTDSPFIYEKDYDLGDIVTAKNDDWGIGMDARITEVKEIYEAGKPFQVEVTFGKDKPTFMDVIKKEFSGIQPEMRR